VRIIGLRQLPLTYYSNNVSHIIKKRSKAGLHGKSFKDMETGSSGRTEQQRNSAATAMVRQPLLTILSVKYHYLPLLA
jgi:hypothetical protein